MNRRSQEDQPGRRPVIVRDQRRGDLVALQSRHRGGGEPDGLTAPGRDATDVTRAGPRAGPPPGDAGTEALRARLHERTADLQRLKAEYDNYRKRVRRDHLAVREVAVANVLARLLPVVDAIDAAREQGEVTGGFGRVADILEGQLSALGLESVGEEGEAFDPAVHEAVAHVRTHPADRATCAEVRRFGYRVGGHLLRPAQVVVAGPPPAPAHRRPAHPSEPGRRDVAT